MCKICGFHGFDCVFAIPSGKLVGLINPIAKKVVWEPLMPNIALLLGWEGVRCETSWEIGRIFAESGFLRFWTGGSGNPKLWEVPGSTAVVAIEFWLEFQRLFLWWRFHFLWKPGSGGFGEILGWRGFLAKHREMCNSCSESAQKACFCHSEVLIGPWN